MDLQRADARRHVEDARKPQPLQFQHQGVHPQSQRQIEHDRAVFDENVTIALTTVKCLRPRLILIQRRKHRGGARRPPHAACSRLLRYLKFTRFGTLKRRIQGLLGRARRGFIDAFELHPVSWGELTEFPQVRTDDDERTDEAAERGAVGSEDDWHVAGEVEGADRIGIVVDV